MEYGSSLIASFFAIFHKKNSAKKNAGFSQFPFQTRFIEVDLKISFKEEVCFVYVASFSEARNSVWEKTLNSLFYFYTEMAILH